MKHDSFVNIRRLVVVCVMVWAGVRASQVSAEETSSEPQKWSVVHETPPILPLLANDREPMQQRGAISSRGGLISVQVNVDALGNNIPGDAANEPSLAIDPTDPNRMVIGWRQFDSNQSDFRQAGWAYTADGGETWTFPGVLEEGVFRSDPVLRAYSDGTIYYYSLTSDLTCDMYTSFDGGMNWKDFIPAFGGDKAWMEIDTTGGIGDGHIYLAWSTGGGCCGNRTFSRSIDGGLTFSQPSRIQPIAPVFGTLSVGPDGELYVCGIDGPFVPNDNFLLSKSTNAQDSGSAPTWDFQTAVDLGGSMLFASGVNPGGLLGQTWVATDHSTGPTRGNVYMLCSVDPPGPDPLDVHFARSIDGGLTFAAPVRVNDDTPTANVWQWFGTMGVAPNGRIDAFWNDTRNDAGADFSELFYATSTNGGDTWSENVAASEAFNHFLGYPVQQKLGDYYDIVSTDDAVHIAYAATFNGEQDVYYLRIPVDSPPSLCEGDANNDQTVDPLDSGYVLARLGCSVGTGDADCDAADVNGDVTVDPLDVGFVQARFGECE